MHAACSICRSQDIETIGAIQRRSVTKKGIITYDMHIGLCMGCGFAFQHPTPSDEDFIQIHRDVYYPNWSDSQSVRAHARQIFDRVVQAITLPEHYSVLDIGCGEGSLLEVFNKHDARCWGVEVREEIREDKLEAQGISVLKKPFKEICFEQTFDLIIMDNVLEHIPDPVSFLSRVNTILSDKGHLVVLVPYASTESDEAFIPEHANFFTPNTLRNLCEASCGFETIIPPREDKSISIYKKSLTRLQASISNEYPQVKSIISGYITNKRLRDNIISNRLQRIIDTLFAQGRSLVLFGAGSYALYLIEHLDLNSELFLGLVDSNPLKAGKTFLDHPVHCVKELARLQPNVVLIGTENVLFINEIRALLQQAMPCAHYSVMTMLDIRSGRSMIPCSPQAESWSQNS